MKLMADSVYVESVANNCASTMSMSAVSENTGPLVSASTDGGTLKITPTAPESSTSGAVNSQNGMPPPPMPLSNGKLA